MKKLISEIRGQDTAELQAKLSDLRKEQFGLRFRGSVEAIAKTARHREVRRTIARIMMVIGERGRGAQPIVTPQPDRPQTGTPPVGKVRMGKAPAEASPKKAKSPAKGAKK